MQTTALHDRRWRRLLTLGLVTTVGSTLALGDDPVAPAPETKPTARPTLYKDGRVIPEGSNVVYEQDSYPRRPARLGGLKVSKHNGQVAIAFQLDRSDDVRVQIVNQDGKTIRHLAHGVLGARAPRPFQVGRLSQRIVWDGRDDDGNPVPVDSCRVRVEVGLTPVFDRFVGYDPKTIGLYVTGIETDHKGRVYVASASHFGQGTVKRFDRDGNYLETVFPPNPASLQTLGKTAIETFDWDDVDGAPVPQRVGLHISYVVGGPWQPWYPHPKARDIGQLSYWSNFPLRICQQKGRAYLVGDNPSWAPSRTKRPLPFLFYPVPSLDPCWMLERMRCYSQAWAIDRQGHGYWTRGGCLYKFHLETGKLAADFTHDVSQKRQKRSAVLGSRRVADATHLGPVKDLAVDDLGNILMLNAQKEGVQVYKPSGELAEPLSAVAVGDRKFTLKSVYGIRSVPGALYLLADVAEIDGRRVLLKLSGSALKPRGIWHVALGPLSRHVAADTTQQPAVVWVGNGSGLATFTRIVDQGPTVGEVHHLQGLRGRTFAAPHALGLDGLGRLYVYDKAFERIVRTSDDGSGWVELDNGRGAVQSMSVNRKEGLVFVGRPNGIYRYDLDLANEKRVGASNQRLGGTDAEGNFYVTVHGARHATNNRVDKYNRDGKLKQAGYCALNLGGTPAVDQDGSVYVIDSAAIPFAAMHDAHGGYRRSGEEFSAGWRTTFLVRFARGGGKRNGEGELWAHLGVSPVTGSCTCWEAIAVTLDESGRVFVTDRDRFHIKVLDKAGNLVARIGQWGNTDSRTRAGDPVIAFGVPLSPVANDACLYAADGHLFRVVKVRLGYRQVEEAAIGPGASKSGG